MISLETALKLRQAGLKWLPAVNDFFAVPERDMDERIFVISEVQASLGEILGQPVIAFQGASEWALDNLLTSEAVWLPREDQLRTALEAALLNRGDSELQLMWDIKGYTIQVRIGEGLSRFSAPDANEAYAAALLHILET
jgi:hypothetical protein